MPLPLLLIPALTSAAGVLAGLIGKDAYDVVKERLAKKIRDMAPDILQGAVDNLGLGLDASGHLNDETITAAINQNLLGGSGLQLASIFDRQKMLKGFEGLAVKRMANDLGLGEVNSVSQIRGALQKWLENEVGTQLAEQAGEVFNAGAGLAKQSLINKIELGKDKKPGWNEPSDFTREGTLNRERQKRWRASHKKHWVQR